MGVVVVVVRDAWGGGLLLGVDLGVAYADDVGTTKTPPPPPKR